MMPDSEQNATRDILHYPPEYLRTDGNRILIPVTYKRTWDDGFGARGWKLDIAIDDPVIIAATRETGEKINTSVFVHDILDHFLSGFGISGHRSEAMALIQLSKRTGSDPASDYEQLVKEDILNGQVNGEELIDFLPEELRVLVPDDAPDFEIIALLSNQLGKGRLIELLVENFFRIGHEGESHADNSWQKLGLDKNKQTQSGRALQKLVETIDKAVEQNDIEELNGEIEITRHYVTFHTPSCDFSQSVEQPRVNIADNQL
ncbi:hypothetical protein [Thiohalophilus sp.]|uniref:hypothetical protein n=1 Tax=Thiohalophilus sp. TaxID=3028392 RepID=UPI002ACDF852|nr:hypothetical protein [Thiohalophilus sp.]MDZ7804248.1 hypothetical protein [Thiohalophilus sp.]